MKDQFVTLRYVLTGAPGAGKTVLLHALAARGWPVIEEAATDVIAALQADGIDQPWTREDFSDRIVALQQQRQQVTPADTAVQIYDRSPLCTLALARYLDRPVSPALRAELNRTASCRSFTPQEPRHPFPGQPDLAVIGPSPTVALVMTPGSSPMAGVASARACAVTT